MKTKSLLLGLLATFGVATTNAGTKVLYQQDFETVTSASEAGWNSTNLASGLSIAPDEFGKYLQFSVGSNNSRSAYTKWGSEIYGETSPSTYTMTFDFNMATAPNKDYASNIAVYTDQAPKDNASYASTYQNFIFDLQQTTDANTWYVNNDQSNTISLSVSTFYTVTLEVNAETRKVDYSITTSAGENITSGTYTVPDGVSMYAEGLHLLAARYQSVFQLDNIKIATQVDGDYANRPTIALTGVGKDANGEKDLNMRAYTITFGEEETLHYIGTDGKEDTANYGDCDGAFVYYTTTSGTITAWTTSGEATSDKAEATADCSPCVLPQASVAITSVKAGYGKTYTVTIDNTTTPLAPQIFFTYIFTPKGGAALAESEEKGTGSTITVDEEGTLVITTKAFGYESSTVTVENNIEYELAKKYDFVNMSATDIAALGFEKEDNLVATTQSGEGNWTARNGMWYWDAADYAKAEDGTETGTKVYPFGQTTADGFIGDGIVRYKLLSSKLAECYNTMFPGLEMWQDFNMQWKQNIGIIVNTMKKGDAEDGSSMAKAGTVNIKINNLADGNIIVVKKVSNYGQNMEHPVCTSASEYNLYDLANVSEVYNGKSSEWATAEDGSASVTFALYRIDTALAGIEIYAAKNGGTGIQGITADKVAVEDANAPYYTISGMKVAKPTQKGIYIHNGKKIIIK